MKPARIYRGDTWTRTWILSDADDVAVDLTGAAVRLQVRDTDGVLKLEYTHDDSLTVTPAEGTIELAAPFADTEALTPASYSFGLEVTLDGVRTTYEQNTLVIIEDTARDE